MATQSSPPPPDSGQPQPAAATGLAPSVNEIQQNANEELVVQSPPSVFVNSEPMREEQVQNAVKFLSHPKVRGSPVMYRRSFLEKKGLTKEEIDEAFRRVPDPPPSSQATGTTQEARVNSAPTIQPSSQTQVFHSAADAPTNAISSVGTSTRYQFHWYHAVFAVGILAASGAGTALLVKKTIIPRLKSWIRKVVFEEEDDSAKKIDAKPSLAEEAAAAAKAAAAAAADVAKASQEILNSKNEEKRSFEVFMKLLDVQVKEMKSMGTAIRKLEGQNNNFGRTSSLDQDDYTFSAANKSRSLSVQQTYVNGKTEYDSRSVRSSSPPTSTEPSVAPHSKSYMEIMAMVQRGERPSNIMDINDQPPNPNQQISNPRLAPRSKPWEHTRAIPSQVNGERFGSKPQQNGLNHTADSENYEPWWQQKNAKNIELENDGQLKVESVTARTPDPPVQRRWVPPQPPPVVMPEAAEAIRRPKPAVQTEQLSEDRQSVSQPAEVTDELQRVTKTVESEVISSEIKEEQELGYSGN